MTCNTCQHPRRRRIVRLLRGALIITGVVLLIRRFAPRMRDRCVEACEGMMDAMPDSFPPKQMINNLETIRGQNARIIELLEERSEAGAATE